MVPPQDRPLEVRRSAIRIRGMNITIEIEIQTDIVAGAPIVNIRLIAIAVGVGVAGGEGEGDVVGGDVGPPGLMVIIVLFECAVVKGCGRRSILLVPDMLGRKP